MRDWARLWPECLLSSTAWGGAVTRSPSRDPMSNSHCLLRMRMLSIITLLQGCRDNTPTLARQGCPQTPSWLAPTWDFHSSRTVRNVCRLGDTECMVLCYRNPNRLQYHLNILEGKRGWDKLFIKGEIEKKNHFPLPLNMLHLSSMIFMSKNLLIHEAIKVETAMINQVRSWDYFLSQDRKSLIIHPLTKERYHSSKALGSLLENKSIIKL